MKTAEITEGSKLKSIYNICLSVGRKKAMEAVIPYAGMTVETIA